ncbi:MAG: YceI family protein, partial [Chitinophagaceae bacterium]
PDGDGTFPVTVDGQMTIHGVTKEYKVPGTLEVKNGQVTATATFDVHLADHHIQIPKIVYKNIAEVLAIKVKAVYSPLNQK